MLRRQVRLRKEYLYRKSLEDQERTILEKKKKLKRALDDGKPIPTELRKDEAELRRLMQFDDDGHDKVDLIGFLNFIFGFVCFLKLEVHELNAQSREGRVLQGFGCLA